MENPPRATKLPLGIRKGVKDNFEARLPKWIDKLTFYTAAPTPLQIDVDILQLYAYAKVDWQKQSFGGLIGSYLETLVESVGKYTETGTDLDTQKCFARAIHKYRITLDASDKTDYCGFEIMDGTLRIVLHPEKFATNICNMTSDKLAQTIDSAMIAEDPNYIPVVMLRGVQTHLNPKLASSRETLRMLFGKDIEISYDLRAILNILTLPQNIAKLERRYLRQEGVLERSIPQELAEYFEDAVRKLKSLNFHLDDLYKSEWLKAAPKGMMFEVDDQLETNAPYNECIFGDGYFRLRTTPQYFGLHHTTIADRVIDQL